MKKSILLYGLAMAVLLALLKFLQYKYLIRDLGIEVYLTIVAVFFTVLGIWAGLKLTNPKQVIQASEEKAGDPEAMLAEYGISNREFEVLQLMAKGHSNQEIADELFLSLNTIKTHSTNLFSKLDVKRRTQAVDKAKSIGIL
ncbi:MAG: DNA-binding response regulator [Saprospiraceae bacterium]|nr:DNA-binding response regulator [Saprospiraceae bacterium]